MLLQYGGKRYPVQSLDDLTLKHATQLQHELGSGAFDRVTSVRTMEDVRGVLGEWGSLPKADRVRHPEAMFLTCLTLWATLALAGEDLTLMEAIDVPLSSIDWVREPTDRQEVSGPKAHPGGQSGHARQSPRKTKRKG